MRTDRRSIDTAWTTLIGTHRRNDWPALPTAPESAASAAPWLSPALFTDTRTALVRLVAERDRSKRERLDWRPQGLPSACCGGTPVERRPYFFRPPLTPLPTRSATQSK